jgi:DNA-binding NtrC family response regulator
MKSSFKILLVEDSEPFRGAVSQLLGVYNDVEGVGDLASARKAVQKLNYDVVILDKSLPDGDGSSLISEIKDLNPNAVVIILTSDSDFASIRQCMSRGADEYVTKTENVVPDLLVRIPIAVSKAASTRRLASLEQQVKDAFRYELVGKSPATIELREHIMSLKGSNAHVLITGESGTGKELIARRLNAVENDHNRPFIALNCGAIAENLIESELFGHKKGAFTGALQDRAGRFELAHNGDLFLDEIGEMPLAAQVRLLRVIQEGEVTRVGESRPIRVNCRIIAATNKNLEEMVRRGKFRDDLFHRLNVIRISTTPLRDRMIEVPDISKLFVLHIGGVNMKLSNAALVALTGYDWPGNIRELRNAIDRAVIAARRRGANEIKFEDVNIGAPNNDLSFRHRKIEASLPAELAEVSKENYEEYLLMAEREYMRSALELARGNLVDLANRIGVSRATIFRRINELGLRFKDGRVIDDQKSIRRSDSVKLELTTGRVQ